MKKLILFLLLIPSLSFGLSDAYKSRIHAETLFLLSGKPIIYTWGAADARGLKADCSGYGYSVFKYCGLPVKRTTSLRMSMGLDTWSSLPIKLDDVEETDLIFFSWVQSAKTRPNGHVGFLIEAHRSNLLEVTHASASKKQVIVQQYNPYLLRSTTAIRRLTFGDKNGK